MGPSWCGFEVQGLFEARQVQASSFSTTCKATTVTSSLACSWQVEVSEEFAAFLADRVLTAPRIVDELANGTRKADFNALLRRVGNAAPSSALPPSPPQLSRVPQLLWQCRLWCLMRWWRRLRMACVTSHGSLRATRHMFTLRAPSTSSRRSATACSCSLRATLKICCIPSSRVCVTVQSADLRTRAASAAYVSRVRSLVGAEDEIVLIIVGGILGAAAGLVQLRFGWGGPSAVAKMAARRA